MAKYHINKRSEASVCRAKHSCPLADESNHYGSKEEALQAYEASMSAKAVPVKRSKEASVKQAKVAAAVGAHRSLHSIYNFFEETYGEAEFDATEAGRLGLKRRLMGEEYSRDEYLARLKAAENAPLPEVGEITYPPHAGWQGKDAHGLLPATEVRPAYDNRQDPLKKQDQVEVTRLSQEWMEKLTPEEQEAVAWMTSNGSGVLLSHHYGQEHKMWGYDVYNKAFVEQANQLVASATRKGAKLEEPMVIYRGVNMNDEVENFDASTLWQVGEIYSVNTPESSSAAPDVARSHTSFNQPTVYEYEITTACATACVSAWRSSELEFLVPYKKFECVGFHEDVRFGESDTPVRVVQFRELPEASD